MAFYVRILTAQKKLADAFAAAGPEPRQGEDLRALLSGRVPTAEFPFFLAAMSQASPAPVAEAARELLREDETRWQNLLADHRDGNSSLDAAHPHSLLAHAYLQPWAEWLTQKARLPYKYERPTCPFCDSSPVAGALHPEGYGARRTLICSLCSAEWDYQRVLCPACGEDRGEFLPVFTAPEYAHVRLEACESCKTYIKSVDLTQFGLAVPVVDELAAVPLSLWAQEHGYRKLHPNLFGL